MLNDDFSHYPPPATIRSSHAWRTLRNRFREHCRRINAPCAWCIARGDTELSVIDYRAPRFAPSGFEARIIAIDKRPDLALAWENLQPCHMRCNRQKGTKAAESQGEWVKPDW